MSTQDKLFEIEDYIKTLKRHNRVDAVDELQFKLSSIENQIKLVHDELYSAEEE